MNALVEAWKEGGWGMFPVAAVLVAAVLVVIERAQWFWRSSFDAEKMFGVLEERVRSRDVAGAITECTLVHAPVVRVALAGLTHLHRVDAEVRAAVAQAVLREKPRAGRRLGWLAMIAPVAALLGFLGTITGAFICSYSSTGGHSEGGPTIDPARKAELLAGGMSEALHCTQFGLLAALVAGVGYAFFRALEAGRERELDAAAAWAVALADTHRAQTEGGVPYR